MSRFTPVQETIGCRRRTISAPIRGIALAAAMFLQWGCERDEVASTGQVPTTARVLRTSCVDYSGGWSACVVAEIGGFGRRRGLVSGRRRPRTDTGCPRHIMRSSPVHSGTRMTRGSTSLSASGWRRRPRRGCVIFGVRSAAGWDAVPSGSGTMPSPVPRPSA